MKTWGKWVRRLLPLAVLLILAVGILCSGLSWEELLAYVPEQPALAAVFLIALYALKSVSFVLPLAALYAAGGLLFTRPVAICVNLVGLAAAVTILYWTGRHAGRGMTENLIAKYPKLGLLLSGQTGQGILSAALMRAIGVVPFDVMSLALGAVELPYGGYVLGSLLGSLPRLLAATLLGSAASDAESGAVVLTLLLNAAVAGVSALAGALYIRHIRKRKPQGDV